MEIKRIAVAYFSGTGTTKQTVEEAAALIAKIQKVPMEIMDFSLPEAREQALCFQPEDLVLLGTPVIAGRVPNVLLKYLEKTEGNGALAVPLVLFGNRDYDNALIELRDILERAGAHTIAAGAFVGEHSFSDTLAAGRPDAADRKLIARFAEKVAEKATSIQDPSALNPVFVKGIPDTYGGYYQPKDRNGVSIDIRKVKPKTKDSCTNCGLCAQICPLGSIDPKDVSIIKGICMKCCACVKRCPQKAKFFDDPGYLYHKSELEAMYERRAEPSLFF